MRSSRSTDDIKPPKPPVITSGSAAAEALARWIQENRFDTLTDVDGLAWRLTLAVDQVPDRADAKGVGLLWRVRAHLAATVTAQDLVRTGTLDAAMDARLIDLLQEDELRLTMKPLTYTVPTEDAARMMLAEVLPKLRTSFGTGQLRDVKRALVGRHVDERGRFGGKSQ